MLPENIPFPKVEPQVWPEKNVLISRCPQDVAFEIGRFYYGIREYENALKFYRDSSDNVGQHHVTFHNMGLCYYSMGMCLILEENMLLSLVVSGLKSVRVLVVNESVDHAFCC